MCTGPKWAEGVGESSAWTKEGWGNRTLEKITELAALWFKLLTKCYSGDEVERRNMARAWEEEKCLQKFDVEV